MGRPWRTAIALVAGVVVFAFVARTLGRHWHEFRQLPLELHWTPGWIVLAAAIIWATYLLLIGAWRAVVQGWGESIAFMPAAGVWAISSLGKYVPGKVWALAGLAMLARSAGVRAVVATSAAILLQFLALGTGAVVAGFTGLQALETARPGARIGLLVVTVGAAVGVALLLWPPTATRLLRVFRPDQDGLGAAPPRRAVLLATAGNGLAWLGYGTATWCLARGILPAAAVPPWALLTGAFAASYLAGLLALFAPGGVLVREALLVALLQPTMGLPQATALAVASRVLLTLTELGVAVPFLVTQRRRRDPA